MKRKHLAIVAVCLFALLMRWVYLSAPVKIDTDGRLRYDPQARNLLAGHGFSNSISPPYRPDAAEHNPGYAFFLAGIYFVSNYNLQFLAFVQVLVELSSIYLVWLIAGLLNLPDRAKQFAVAIGLICPLLPRYIREVLSEVPATFSITLALYLVLLAVKRGRAHFWIAAGFGCALAWFIRADQLAIILLLVVTAAIISRQIARPILLVLTFFAVASPWIVRNYHITGKLRPLADLTDKSRHSYNQWLNTWITGMDDHDRYLHRAKPDPKIDYENLASQEKSKNKVRAYFAVPILRFMNVLLDDLNHDLYKGFKWIPLHVTAYGTVLLGCLGIAIMFYRREWILLLPFCVIVGRWSLPALSALAMHFRLLLEAMPALYIFAGIAANTLYASAAKLLFEKRVSRLSAQENPISRDTSDV